jgi:hypothetical protein
MYHPFRSARYEEVREAGLNDWELFVVEDWAPKRRGKEVLLSELQKDIESSQLLQRAPGRPKLSQLAAKYPEVISLKRRTANAGAIWYVKVY